MRPEPYVMVVRSEICGGRTFLTENVFKTYTSGKTSPRRVRGKIQEAFLGHSGVVLGWVRGRPGVVPVASRDRSSLVSGSFRSRSRTVLGQFQVPKSIKVYSKSDHI